jgi:hypothetical protein
MAGLLTFSLLPAFPLKTVTILVGAKVCVEITAAVTVADFHGFPY